MCGKRISPSVLACFVFPPPARLLGSRNGAPFLSPEEAAASGIWVVCGWSLTCTSKCFASSCGGVGGGRERTSFELARTLHEFGKTAGCPADWVQPKLKRGAFQNAVRRNTAPS